MYYIQDKETHEGTPISAADYLWNRVSRANWPQVADRFNTPVDQFTQLHKHKHSHKMKTEGDDIVINTCTSIPHMTEHPRCTNVENTESVSKMVIEQKTQMIAANNLKN